MDPSKKATDRRKEKRFRVKVGALAAVRPYLIDRNPIGTILDISLSGLSFSYFSNGEIGHELPELDVCLQDNGFYIGQLPFKTISDAEVREPGALVATGERRRGVQFGDLTDKQTLQLQDFIEKFSIGEV